MSTDDPTSRKIKLRCQVCLGFDDFNGRGRVYAHPEGNTHEGCEIERARWYDKPLDWIVTPLTVVVIFVGLVLLSELGVWR